MSREKNAIIQSFNKIYLELIDDSQFARQSGEIYDTILECNSGSINAKLCNLGKGESNLSLHKTWFRAGRNPQDHLVQMNLV